MNTIGAGLQRRRMSGAPRLAAVDLETQAFPVPPAWQRSLMHVVCSCLVLLKSCHDGSGSIASRSIRSRDPEARWPIASTVTGHMRPRLRVSIGRWQGVCSHQQDIKGSKTRTKGTETGYMIGRTVVYTADVREYRRAIGRTCPATV